MTKKDKAADDLAYIRKTLERQQRLVCEHVPLWFAVLVGIVFGVSAALKDLVAHGMLGEGTRDMLSDGGAIIVLIAFLAMAFRKIRRDKKRGESKNFGESVWLAAPIVVVFIGIAAIKLAGDTFGLTTEAVQAFTIILLSVGFVLLGLQGLPILGWFGAGIGIGAIPMIYTDFAFSYTALGLGLGAGLIIGAWRTHRTARTE